MNRSFFPTDPYIRQAAQFAGPDRRGHGPHWYHGWSLIASRPASSPPIDYARHVERRSSGIAASSEPQLPQGNEPACTELAPSGVSRWGDYYDHPGAALAARWTAPLAAAGARIVSRGQ